MLTREILFSVLLTEPLAVFGLQKRVELYLELLGNLHVRSQTFEYLQHVSSKLISLVNLDKIELPFTAQMKFDRRSYLELYVEARGFGF